MSGRKILVILSLVLVLSIALASLGIAYAGGVGGKGVLGLCFSLTSGVIVILSQLIPAGILLSSLAGRILSFSRDVKILLKIS